MELRYMKDVPKEPDLDDEAASHSCAALKDRINRMNYEDMVRALRFAPIGDPMFIGEVGDFFGHRLRILQSELSTAAQVAVSKLVGYDSPKE
jgi:hypothetical protein